MLSEESPKFGSFKVELREEKLEMWRRFFG
jgi:hypothetical protein